MVPQDVLNCLAAGGAAVACMSPDNHFDSIIALDLGTGAVRWAARGPAQRHLERWPAG